MIVGIGTDIVEVERIRGLVSKGKPYLEGIFTSKEIEYCEGKARRAQHYAVRYAAKEAALKALSIGWRDGLSFPDIEIIDDELGKPQIFVHGKVKELFERQQVRRTSVSLSHSKDSAIAVVILEN